MKSLDLSMQLLGHCDDVQKDVIQLSCAYTGVTVQEFFSDSKTRRIANCRAVVGQVLFDNGYNSIEVGEAMKISQRRAYHYATATLEKVDDQSFKSPYENVKNSMGRVKLDGKELEDRMNNLALRVELMEQRVNHITQLLTE